jgi:hypothetical protein
MSCHARSTRHLRPPPSKFEPSHTNRRRRSSLTGTQSPSSRAAPAAEVSVRRPPTVRAVCAISTRLAVFRRPAPTEPAALKQRARPSSAVVVPNIVCGPYISGPFTRPPPSSSVRVPLPTPVLWCLSQCLVPISFTKMLLCTHESSRFACARACSRQRGEYNCLKPFICAARTTIFTYRCFYSYLSQYRYFFRTI